MAVKYFSQKCSKIPSVNNPHGTHTQNILMVGYNEVLLISKKICATKYSEKHRISSEEF